MSEYTLIDNVTGERHELDHENMVDIGNAVTFYLKKRHRDKVCPCMHQMPKAECMPETVEKISKVRTSMTDY